MRKVAHRERIHCLGRRRGNRHEAKVEGILVLNVICGTGCWCTYEGRRSGAVEVREAFDRRGGILFPSGKDREASTTAAPGR